jgi:hypothetical protein
MNQRSSLLLLLIVLGLGGLVYWQTESEGRGDYDMAEPLFAGVDWSRVHAIRTDNLERSVHVKLERDARGVWFITDPIAYPAEDSVIRNLLEYLQSNWATDVPSAEIEEARKGFDPPRIALTVYEQLESGSELQHRIEIGALDIDGSRMYVRRSADQASGDDAPIWRTVRNLDTLLQRHVDEFRSKSIFRLAIPELIEYRRDGYQVVEDGSVALHLNAEQRGRHWWMSRPQRAQIDPQIIAILLANTASISVDSFSAEDDSDLARFGLDAPSFFVELGDRLGNKQTVHFGQPELHSAWFCKRDDLPYVWRLPDGKAFNLMMPGKELYDSVLMRAFRQDIRTIEFFGREQHMRLTQAQQDRWTVAQRAPDAEQWGQEFQADARQVESILTTLEQTRIDHDQSDELGLELIPDDGLRGVWVQLDEDRQGGRIGDSVVTPAGSAAFAFRRDGESIVSLVPAALEALLHTPARDLHSLYVLNLEENQLSRLTFSHDGKTREFRRTTKSIWQYVDLEAEATELVPYLDKIFFLRAERHLADSDETLLEPVTLDVLARQKEMSVSLVIGKNAAGEVVAEIDGRRSVLRDQDLHALLIKVINSEGE